MLDFLILIASLALIIVGANALTDGASSIAKRFHISDLVIGLTIVALGTSMPEFVVSFVSSVHGSAGMAVGNIVGSNIFNTLVIVGVTSIISPIHVEKGNLSKDIPFNLLAAIVLFICCNDVLIGGANDNVIGRVEALLLVGFFLIFLRYTFTIASTSGSVEKEEKEEKGIGNLSLVRSIFYIVFGLAMLVLGGEWFVSSGCSIARMFGVSESVIALTLMSGGTSAPEFATSVVAARKGKVDMAIGNVIGSNIFNIFFVLGVCGTVTPLAVGEIGNLELGTLVVSGIILWVTGVFYKTREITRVEGFLMLAIYLAYTIFLVLR